MGRTLRLSSSMFLSNCFWCATIAGATVTTFAGRMLPSTPKDQVSKPQAVIRAGSSHVVRDPLSPLSLTGASLKHPWPWPSRDL